MIRIIGKIPREVTVACSGGLDSMSVVHFLLQGKRKVKLAYFDHDTRKAHDFQNFVENYASDNKLDLIIGRARGRKTRRQSLEEFWREERYGFFGRIRSNFIITCHHLDDCVETWLMSSFHGKGKLIPYKRSPNIYRPFLMTEKVIIKKYARKHSVSWIEDPTNQDVNFMRNQVRLNIIPQVLKVNPGIRTTIRKKILDTCKDI